MEVEQAAMEELLPSIGGLSVLDAGCGTGRYARILRAGGGRLVVAVDVSAAMLARASADGVARVRGDIRALPFADASFDLVVSGLMLPDIAELDRVAREWHRVLRPGGLVVCSTLHPIGADLGWTRTFDTPHGTRALPAFWHSLGDHRRACEAAGLVIEASREPYLKPRDRRHDARDPHPTVPVALVVRARRAG
jgi:malonyl-CoA O-methyltransferase